MVKEEKGAEKTERKHEDKRRSGRNKCLCLAQCLTMSMGWLKDGSGFYLHACEGGFLSALRPVLAFPPAL